VTKAAHYDLCTLYVLVVSPDKVGDTLSQDTFCPEATASSFCLFLFKLGMLVGWVMDWKCADFHNGLVIFGGVVGKKPFFKHI
jgi:hypothetical protein